MHRRRLALLAIFTTVAALLACGEPTEPDRPTGRFVLRTVDGQPLPVLVKEQRLEFGGAMGTRREYLEAMQLVLPAAAVDTFASVKRVTWELDAPGEDGTPPAMEVMQATNVVHGDTLCLQFGNSDDPPNGCAAAQVIRRSGRGIAISLSPAPYPKVGRVEYVFGRE